MSKNIKYLVIHNTATPEGRAITSDDIRRIHCSPKEQDGNGWPEVGFTDLIHLNGKIERLVKKSDDAYIDGFEQMDARHIAFVGGIARNGRTPKDTRTPEQLIALSSFVKKFNSKYPDVKIIGYNQAFDFEAWLKTILPEVSENELSVNQ